MQDIADPQDQNRQDDQTPENAQDHAECCVADEGEEVGTGLVCGVRQNGFAHSSEVARCESVVAAIQTRELGDSDTGGGADDQRLDEALQKDQGHPKARITALQPAGQQVPLANQRVEARVGDTADHSKGQAVHKIVEFGPAGK